MQSPTLCSHSAAELLCQLAGTGHLGSASCCFAQRLALPDPSMSQLSSLIQRKMNSFWPGNRTPGMKVCVTARQVQQLTVTENCPIWVVTYH